MQRGHRGDLLGKHEHERGAGRAGSRRPAGSVQVVFRVVRRIKVHHQIDIVDMNAARGDVGGDEHPRMPRGERVERALPGVLLDVTVDRAGLDTGLA